MYRNTGLSVIKYIIFLNNPFNLNPLYFYSFDDIAVMEVAVI